MLDEPSYPPIESDELIETAATTYGDADPDQVGAELQNQASELAVWPPTQGLMRGTEASHWRCAN